MKTTALLFVSSLLFGCVTWNHGSTTKPLMAAQETCEAPSYDKRELAFHCGSITYDLLQTPVRSRRVFDIVNRETFTRRHYLVRSNGRPYAFKAVQMEGERFPRTIVLETPAGFFRVLLDDRGNMMQSARVGDLSG